MGKFIVVILALGFALGRGDPAAAQTRTRQPDVQRSANGTVIQPTRTIIRHEDGSTTVIVVPRRTYLDPGTDVSLGYGSRLDYAFPPAGDPGRPYWFYGPDVRGAGSFPQPPAYYVPGWNPNNPF